MVASVPELTKRTNSIDGTSSTTLRANAVSSSVGAPKLNPSAAAALHGRDHLRVGVPQNHGTPGTDVIDEAASVRRSDMSPRSLFEKNRLTADAAERAHR